MRASLKPRPGISRRGRQMGLALATAACVGLGLVGAVLAIFSPLVFDRAGNWSNPLAWLGFALVAGFWVVCLLAPLASWIAWRRGREPIAWAAMAVPLAWAAAALAVLQFVPA